MPLDNTHLADLDEKDALGLLAAALDAHRGRIALVSSFGAESVVLLHLVARIDPAIPVLFLETGMLFPQTLAYQRKVATLLGLADLRIIRPKVNLSEDLHQTDPDACCFARKTRPLNAALDGFDAWITGRKRIHGGRRVDLPRVEADPFGRVKFNPLAAWTAADIESYFARHPLPRHPLVAKGFASIGCVPCTSPIRAGEDPRAGRWRGVNKVECGIHIAPDGRVTKTTGAAI